MSNNNGFGFGDGLAIPTDNETNNNNNGSNMEEIPNVESLPPIPPPRPSRPEQEKWSKLRKMVGDSELDLSHAEGVIKKDGPSANNILGSKMPHDEIKKKKKTLRLWPKFWKRNKKPASKHKTSQPKPPHYSANNLPKSPSVKSDIVANDTNEHIGKVFGSDIILSDHQLKTTHGYTATTSMMPLNKKKNRYANILPNDKTRVTIGNEPYYYTNANLIFDGKYIASQGPLENDNSKADFWHMVWNKSVNTIVMVTNWVENGKKKCGRYFPKYVDKEENKTYGNYTIVTKIKPEVLLNGIVIKTQLTLVNNTLTKGSKRHIFHYHYIAWPDHGVPEKTNDFIDFIKIINNFNNKTTPLLVHCSAGVGRTGTFISAYEYYTNASELKEKSKSNNLLDILVYSVNTMRQQRNASMVQTPSQFIFLYEVCQSITKDKQEIEKESLYGSIVIKPTTIHKKINESRHNKTYPELSQLDAYATITSILNKEMETINNIRFYYINQNQFNYIDFDSVSIFSDNDLGTYLIFNNQNIYYFHSLNNTSIITNSNKSNCSAIHYIINSKQFYITQKNKKQLGSMTKYLKDLDKYLTATNYQIPLPDKINETCKKSSIEMDKISKFDMFDKEYDKNDIILGSKSEHHSQKNNYIYFDDKCLYVDEEPIAMEDLNHYRVENYVEGLYKHKVDLYFNGGPTESIYINTPGSLSKLTTYLDEHTQSSTTNNNQDNIYEPVTLPEQSTLGTSSTIRPSGKMGLPEIPIKRNNISRNHNSNNEGKTDDERDGEPEFGFHPTTPNLPPSHPNDTKHNHHQNILKKNGISSGSTRKGIKSDPRPSHPLKSVRGKASTHGKVAKQKYQFEHYSGDIVGGGRSRRRISRRSQKAGSRPIRKTRRHHKKQSKHRKH